MDREKIIETMKTEMENWHGKLDELKVQVSLGKAELRDAVQPAITNIELELGKLGKHIKEYQEFSGDALERAGASAHAALDAIRKSFKDVSSHIKK